MRTRSPLPTTLLGALVLVPLLLAGCPDRQPCPDHQACWQWDNVPICNPGEVDACLCNTGGPGERVCESDGLEYGECECTRSGSADAGVVDAAVDASIDATIDAAIDAAIDVW